jgi:biopolymer transport protein ExbD
VKFRRGDEDDFTLNVTSLVDIVLMLLIFFMVTSAYVDFAKKMDIQLPSATAGGASQQEKPYKLEVNEDGKIFLDGTPTPLEGIKDALMRDGQHMRKMVVIRADKRLFYGLTVQIMGICRSAGIQEIGLAVL